MAKRKSLVDPRDLMAVPLARVHLSFLMVEPESGNVAASTILGSHTDSEAQPFITTSAERTSGFRRTGKNKRAVVSHKGALVNHFSKANQGNSNTVWQWQYNIFLKRA